MRACEKKKDEKLRTSEENEQGRVRTKKEKERTRRDNYYYFLNISPSLIPTIITIPIDTKQTDELGFDIEIAGQTEGLDLPDPPGERKPSPRSHAEPGIGGGCDGRGRSLG